MNFAMINEWDSLLLAAARFVAFVQQATVFGKAYAGTTTGRLILTDAAQARNFAQDDSGDAFDEWQAVSDSPVVFPATFEWKRWIDHNLQKNNFFGVSSKNFSGAAEKWELSEANPLMELMQRDIRIILNCYANESFPAIWESIEDVYLNNGFPCGWNGRYPQGNLVVFSNF